MLKKPLIQNAATVASGTAVAQAVAMAFSPIITRLYGPEAFGLQGVFVSLVTLLALVVPLGYQIAIVLPKRDGDAIRLIQLTMIIACSMSAVTLAALLLFGMEALQLLNAEGLGALAYLIPFATLVSVSSGVLGQWLIRKGAFRLSAKYQVVSSIVVASTKTVAGSIHPSAVTLILTNTVGSLAGVVMTLRAWRRHSAGEPSYDSTASTSLPDLAREYRDFPLLRAPQTIINAFSHSLPTLLLSSFFGPTAAGQYVLAMSVLVAPAALIGGSVSSVFFPHITRAIANGENARRSIARATFSMAVVGAAPFLILAAVGSTLFSIVFGANWEDAGLYAQLLAPWVFLQFLNRPAVVAIPALRIQGGLLIYELFSTGTKIFALWLGFSYFESATMAVALFSAFGCAAYIWLILWVLKRSRPRARP